HFKITAAKRKAAAKKLPENVVRVAGMKASGPAASRGKPKGRAAAPKRKSAGKRLPLLTRGHLALQSLFAKLVVHCPLVLVIQHLECLGNLLELALGGLLVLGIAVGMVFESQFLVCPLQRLLVGTPIHLQDLVIVPAHLQLPPTRGLQIAKLYK